LSGQGKRTAKKSEGATLDDRKRILSEAIQQHQQDLLTGIRVYLWRLEVVKNRGGLEERSKDIFQEMVIQALKTPANYDPSWPAKTWLLGVAINEIRHLKRKLGIERRYIRSIADTSEGRNASRDAAPTGLSETELFDLLNNRYGSEASRHTLDEILSVVGESDRRVLWLHFVEGLSGHELGAALGISEGYAYVRLSRAKAHLRAAFLKTRSN